MMRKILYVLISIMMASSAWGGWHDVHAAPQSIEYKRVDVGRLYTAALTKDGTLSVWGYMEGMNDKTYLPVIGKAKEWAEFSAGYEFITAIKKDGTMWGWGFNGVGQVGNGTTTTVQKPVQIGKNKKWRTVTNNFAHSVAIASDGTLWSWGYNSDGQLGTGDLKDRYKPVQIGKDKNWVRVITGRTFTIGIKKDGSTYAWGSGIAGSLGNGKSTKYQTTPVKTGNENWKSISAGAEHVLALKPDGSLWGWGYNGSGLLGNGTDKNVLKPIRIGKDSDWVAVSATGYSNLAIKKDGTLWAWGWDYGSKPRQLGADRDWSMIAKHASPSTGHVMLQKKDGSLWGWGENYAGQITMGRILEDRSDRFNGTNDIYGIPIEASQAEPAPWAAADVMLAKQHKLLADIDLHYYKSDTSRRLAAKLFYQLHDALSWDHLPERKDLPYEDLEKEYYSNIALQAGFIDPLSKNKFGVHEPMTRQDFLLGIYRVLQASGFELDPLPRQWTKNYADADEVSAKATAALQYLDQAGLLADESDLLRPGEMISREEAYAYIWRAYKAHVKNTPYTAVLKDLFYKGYRILAGKSDIGEHYFVYDTAKDKELANWDYYFPRTDGSVYSRNVSLPTDITINYTPGKDEFKLDLIAEIIEKERGISLPSFKQSLLEKFRELRIDDLPYGKSTGVQFITVDGKELLIILFNETKTKERILEVDY